MSSEFFSEKTKQQEVGKALATVTHSLLKANWKTKRVRPYYNKLFIIKFIIITIIIIIIIIIYMIWQWW